MKLEELIEKYKDLSVEDMSNESALDLNEEFKNLSDIFYDLFTYANIFINDYSVKFDTESLDLASVAILREIQQNPGITANNIATKFSRSAAFMSRTLRKLEDGCYINREIDQDNRIYFKIYLTDKGEDFIAWQIKREIQVVQDFLDYHYGKYSTKDLGTFVEILRDSQFYFRKQIEN